MKKMNHWKRIFVAALAAVMVMMPLAGCKNNSDSQTTDGNDRPTIKIYTINGNYYSGSVKDEVWKYIEDQAGVNIEITGQINSDDYYTVLSPLMNSATDMPDIIFCTPDSTSGAYENWANQATGVLYDWMNLLIGKEEEYPYLYKIMTSDQYGGITYSDAQTLLPMMDTANLGWGIFYRADWLIKIGYYTEDENGNKVARVPTNMDEFQDVMMKFSDPSYNLNPNAATYGMSPFCGEWANQPLYHAFGVSTDYDLNDEGKVEYMLLTDEYRNFLEWFHSCYEKGWIDPNFYANGYSGDVDAFEEGRCGILINTGIQWIAKRVEDVWGDGTVIMGPPPVGTKSVGEEGAGGWSNWGGWWGGFSITRACEDPDAALRLMNYLLSEEGAMTALYGIEGTHWNWNADKTEVVPNLGNRAKTYDSFVTSTDSEGHTDYYGRYKWSNLILVSAPVDWDYYDETGEFRFFYDWNSVSLRFAHLYKQNAQYYDMLSTSKLTNVSALSPSLNKKANVVGDLCDTYTIQVIVGQKNLTTDWDALLESCKAQDYQKILNAYQTAAEELGLTK